MSVDATHETVRAGPIRSVGLRESGDAWMVQCDYPIQISYVR